MSYFSSVLCVYMPRDMTTQMEIKKTSSVEFASVEIHAQKMWFPRKELKKSLFPLFGFLLSYKAGSCWTVVGVVTLRVKHSSGFWNALARGVCWIHGLHIGPVSWQQRGIRFHSLHFIRCLTTKFQCWPHTFSLWPWKWIHHKIDFLGEDHCMWSVVKTIVTAVTEGHPLYDCWA